MTAPEEAKRRITRTEEHFTFNDQLEFSAIQDHILESKCSHVEGKVCQVCKFEKELAIPHLPEMIFPTSSLSLHVCHPPNEAFIEFNAFDALRLVEVGKLPNVKVGPSAVWQEARKELPVRDFQQPFDWTYTSKYKGTVGPNVRVEPTTEEIDYERLKQRETILFYNQMTLYEDELADHGCSQMSVRIRIMPNCFFILCRFYLRVDHVMLRVCDTRLFSEVGKSYCLREWAQREATYGELSRDYWVTLFWALANVLDANLIWPALPEVSKEVDKVFFPGN